MSKYYEDKSHGLGQQQLLVLVLSTVIVALAIIVGAQAFRENAKKADEDALRGDLILFASDAQMWKVRPNAFGGGASSIGWTDFGFEAIGYTTGDNGYLTAVAGSENYENLNGIYTLIRIDSSKLIICGQSYKKGKVFVSMSIEVTGTTPNDLDIKDYGCPWL